MIYGSIVSTLCVTNTILQASSVTSVCPPSTLYYYCSIGENVSPLLAVLMIILGLLWDKLCLIGVIPGYCCLCWYTEMNGLAFSNISSVSSNVDNTWTKTNLLSFSYNTSKSIHSHSLSTFHQEVQTRCHKQ